MAWIQLNTIVEEALAEPLSDALIEIGAVSVTFTETGDQEIFEPEIGTTPIWDQTRVLGLFDAEVNPAEILLALTQWIPQIPPSAYQFEQIEDKDWIREWMDQFKPMQFGQNLWIVPSWLEAPNPNGINLLLDPGLAFGTGTHPTTAMCLKWLDQHPPKDKSVIDYGCGSGILAIAAAKLGADKVSGTDIDPQAITASKDNAQRNRVAIEFNLVKDFSATAADLLIANILAGPLKELASEFERLVKPGGQLVLSGLLASQAPDLIKHYQHYGFNLNQLDTHEDWACLSGYKA
ncbi:50S ribosomal protein L11 methyltransferase [Thiomicrospira microaerophila]|uniref:50S ribosomal protein L11 methyltransferase n=1 Tax=Thiomicrospira microaerophila TaxID=406020 RepID=UPI00200CE4B0|nr:50S ribosomal protein L11 methyltransferase [Thiomicrospira microaerophila]UQB43325.1 50S ribosomal protein L11 methyltransferase [Thiomicrospira microaerophila]